MDRAQQLTERHMLDLLNLRYGQVFGNGARYARAEHVKDVAGHATARIADYIAMDTWPGQPSGSNLALHGHEVKVSRADWLTELRNPDKAEAFRPYMDYWWLVVSDPRILRPGELPAGWGLMALSGSVLRVKISAPRNPDTIPMPRTMLATLLRATAKTAARLAVT